MRGARFGLHRGQRSYCTEQLTGPRVVTMTPFLAYVDKGSAADVAMQLDERVEMRAQHILAAEIRDDPLLVLPVLAVALDVLGLQAGPLDRGLDP